MVFLDGQNPSVQNNNNNVSADQKLVNPAPTEATNVALDKIAISRIGFAGQFQSLRELAGQINNNAITSSSSQLQPNQLVMSDDGPITAGPDSGPSTGPAPRPEPKPGYADRGQEMKDAQKALDGVMQKVMNGEAISAEERQTAAGALRLAAQHYPDKGNARDPKEQAQFINGQILRDTAASLENGGSFERIRGKANTTGEANTARADLAGKILSGETGERAAVDSSSLKIDRSVDAQVARDKLNQVMSYADGKIPDELRAETIEALNNLRQHYPASVRDINLSKSTDRRALAMGAAIDGLSNHLEQGKELEKIRGRANTSGENATFTAGAIQRHLQDII